MTVAVNGNLPFSTVLSDGAETTLPASANSDILTQETIQELQFVTSAFSAQYGVGGIMYNQISKGGTNRFHGSVYEYFQNEALNALPYEFSGQTASTFAITIWRFRRWPNSQREALLLLQLRSHHFTRKHQRRLFYNSNCGSHGW